jgi:phosphoribosylpyrophosphate synthetase
MGRFEGENTSKLEVIDVSKICAAAIERSIVGQSLSEIMVL